MLTSGGAELVSLGSVLPFLAVLTNPESFWQHSFIQNLAIQAGFTEASQLLLPVTAAFALTAVLAGAVRLVNLSLNLRLAAAIGSDLSAEAYRRILYQPYEVHIKRNSSAVINTITSQLQSTINTLQYLLQSVTASIVALALVIGLILIDWTVALSAAALFGSAYVAVSVTTRRELTVNGYKIAEAGEQLVKALQEGLGAFRDVLLDNSQPTYLEIYRIADRSRRQLQAKNNFLGAFPRYALEATAMVAIAYLGAFMIIKQGKASEAIPILGALALGAQRLLPSLQMVYTGCAVLQSSNADLAGVISMLEQPLPAIFSSPKPMPLVEGISLDSVDFRYSQDLPEVLRGITLKIAVGERIGLIGSTGSGKSTTFDILMGLLEPSSGKFLVDGKNIHDPNYPERLASWRATISHVPQSIYLADSSIAENIAFGLPRHQIDLKRVKQAAERAQIASFIESCFHGYASFVGERGIRLSGGQRQRIGIARALYKSSSVLFFDEATSALDGETEQAVMDAFNGLSKDITIVMIAHRLSTVKSCDRVIRLDSGVVIADGDL
mgnify:CR=1 FL=1